MTSQFDDMTSSWTVFNVAVFFLSSLVTGSSSWDVAISVYKVLSGNLEIGNMLV